MTITVFSLMKYDENPSIRWYYKVTVVPQQGSNKSPDLVLLAISFVCQEVVVLFKHYSIVYTTG